MRAKWTVISTLGDGQRAEPKRRREPDLAGRRPVRRPGGHRRDGRWQPGPAHRHLRGVLRGVRGGPGGQPVGFFLMRLRQGRKRSSINVFVINLAVTDFQFVLTLPFWAVDTALDFSWPFGDAMCKIILSVTVMNMYASVFFLTAMSVTRYWSVASALKHRTLPASPGLR